MGPLLRRAVPCALALVLALVAAAGAGAQPLRLGLMDDGRLRDGTPAQIAPWWDRTRALGAEIVRVNVLWREVAPAQPPTRASERDPAWPGYRFERVDQAMREAAARGIRVLLTVYSAPGWAEGRSRPPTAPIGSWRPSARGLAAFARAVAGRYSGRFPDPLRAGATLPRAAAYQAWNEPNLPTYLTPQAEAVARYRALLNGFYRAIKAVDRRAPVVLAGTAPYGDALGRGRTPPARFVRDLLCVRDRGPFRRAPCPRPARFDVLAHHPYTAGGPGTHAVDRDDVTLPELGKLTRPLRAAVRLGTVRPARRKRVWITEVGWDTSPPDPHGIPLARQARWLQLAAYRLWRQGAEVVIWLNVADQPPRPSFATTFQSGLLFADARAKPAARAFRLPFVVACHGHPRHCRAWLKATPRTAVRIERRARRGWRSIRRGRTGRAGLLEVSVRARTGAQLRARSGRATSITWTAR